MCPGPCPGARLKIQINWKYPPRINELDTDKEIIYNNEGQKTPGDWEEWGHGLEKGGRAAGREGEEKAALHQSLSLDDRHNIQL